MALRNILKDNDPTLLKRSRVVTEYNARLHELIEDMRETLLNSEGLGLAAVQVGVLRRVVLVLEIDSDKAEERIIELINPEIIYEAGEQCGPEGCLSIPGVYGMVTRPESVTVRAFDRHGNVFEAQGEGLTARAFCHEIDHLDGIIFTELAERLLTPEELEELKASEEEAGSE